MDFLDFFSELEKFNDMYANDTRLYDEITITYKKGKKIKLPSYTFLVPDVFETANIEGKDVYAYFNDSNGMEAFTVSHLQTYSFEVENSSEYEELMNHAINVIAEQSNLTNSEIFEIKTGYTFGKYLFCANNILLILALGCDCVVFRITTAPCSRPHVIELLKQIANGIIPEKKQSIQIPKSNTQKTRPKKLKTTDSHKDYSTPINTTQTDSGVSLYEKEKIKIECQKLIKELEHSIEAEAIKRDIINELGRLRNELARLEKFKTIFSQRQQKIDKNQAQIEELEKQKSELRQERSQLGLFSGKRKKEIDTLIYKAQRKLNELSDNISALKRENKGYKTKSEICDDIKAVKELEEKNQKDYKRIPDFRSEKEVRNDIHKLKGAQFANSSISQMKEKINE